MSNNPKSAPRKQISKKTRFDVFKRDEFTCQYCSGKPPKVPLEVDHIIPISKGGKNNAENLITACFDCNRGKGARELHIVPLSMVDKIERIKIAKQQYEELKKYMKIQSDLMESLIDEVVCVYLNYFESSNFTYKSRASIKTFINKIGVQEVCDSMDKACCKMNYSHHVWRYFCGICWNKINQL